MDVDIKKEFQELKNLTVLTAKKALTMNDAALFTGMSKSHLYKLVCYKKIPYYKSQGGKFTYFNRDELTAWMLQTRIKTDDELETEAATHIVAGKHSKKGGKHV